VVSRRAAGPSARRGGPGAARPLFLLAHGAGAGSGHPWMRAWRRRLEGLGPVVAFDYPYVRAGRRRPDPLPRLLEAHREALRRARQRRRRPVVLVGKSMGGRVGCHLALEEPVHAVVCLGYPLVGAGRTARVRDEVLLALRVPILFVQGTRDRLCPLERLEDVRRRMRAAHALHVVETGDHSLQATRRSLRAAGESQDDVDERILGALRRFLADTAGLRV